MSFDPVNSLISKDLTLLEASAGTGKTYSLVRIIVRHIVEHKIPLEGILTVTFTRAATAEIKERLHKLLHEVFTEMQLPAEQVSNDLAQKWQAHSEEFRKEALTNLAVALSNFDAVPIFTIDGFFQRLLKEYAFESKSLFSVELETNEAELLDLALRDYWRSEVYSLERADFHDFKSLKVSFEKAFKFLSEILRSPDAELSEAYSQDAEALLRKRRGEVQALSLVVAEYAEALLALVEKPISGLAKTVNPFRKGGYEKVQALVAGVEEGVPYYELDFSCIESLSADRMFSEKAFNKGKYQDLSSHALAPLFTAIKDYKACPRLDIQSAYYGKILRFVRERLREIKRERNIQTYSDVTSKLDQLLHSDSRPAQFMRESIRETYQAALIDEFQDTSPQQCRVFLNLFKHERGYFHIIGDPKQSIYRFRGADVFAYIQASEEAKNKEWLVTNYRSSPDMVHAVNKVFERSDDPFLVDRKIGFKPSAWSDQEAQPKNAALFFQYLDPVLSKAEVFTEATEADICAHVLALLDQPWTEIEPDNTEREAPVSPSDIAILVNSGKEGKKLFDKLSAYGVPTVIQTQTSLLETTEATDLLAILLAVLSPNKPTLLRSALLSKALGYGEVLNDAEALLQASEFFNELKEVWEKRGVMPMVTSLFEDYQTLHRLLPKVKGLRTLTNLMHLAEVLDKKSREEYLSPLDITKWLELAINGALTDTDATVLELRLDTDLPSVRIQTQHSSKGLEFPIVFVTPPCKRRFSNFVKPDLSYHDEESNTIIAALEEEDPAVEAIRKKEACSDRARLAYVALTRAKHRCYFYYLPEVPKAPKENAVYQMLGEPDLGDLYELEGLSDGCIQVNEIGAVNWPRANYIPEFLPRVPELSYRRLTEAQLESKLRTTSFTGLSHNTHSEESYKDQDKLSRSTSAAVETGFWMLLRGGAALGSAFHEILENVDFQDLSTADEVITQKFDKFQPFKKPLSARELKSLYGDVKSYLTGLMSHPLSEGGMTLSELSKAKCIVEPQFVLQRSHYSLPKLAEVLTAKPPLGLPAGYVEKLLKTQAREFEGFLTGFIDLIFEHDGKYHILDWKTNKLHNYGATSLCEAMAESHYYLQYHLYTLALDLFLQERLGAEYDPEKHLGNAYYVFLRGVNVDMPGSGVFMDRLCKTRLEQLRITYTTD